MTKLEKLYLKFGIVICALLAISLLTLLFIQL